MEKIQNSMKLAEAFERLINALTIGKKKGHDYGTGDLLFRSEVHHIALIGKNPNITASEIVKRLGVTKGAVSQIIGKLLKKKYILKTVRGENLREYKLNLTQKGQKAFKVHEQHHAELLAALQAELEVMSSEQIKHFANLVNKLTDHMKDEE